MNTSHFSLNERGDKSTGNPKEFEGFGIVGFIDLLGFSADVLSLWNHETHSPLGRLLRIKRAMSHISDIGIIPYTPGKNPPFDQTVYRVRVHTVSDSLVICSALPRKCGLNDIIMAMSVISEGIQLAWEAAIMEGYTIRGAVEMGEIYWSESETIGPAFVRSYDLESRIAKNSRVIVGPFYLKNLLKRANSDWANWPSSKMFSVSYDDLIEISPNRLKQNAEKNIEGLEALRKNAGDNAERYDHVLKMLRSDSFHEASLGELEHGRSLTESKIRQRKKTDNPSIETAHKKSRSPEIHLCANENHPMMHPYRSVLEDIDWLWKEWWIGESGMLTTGHLRRGSAALWLLLADGLLQNAWEHYGFQHQPAIKAPDIVAFTAKNGYRIDLSPGIIAGGGRQNGLDMAFIGSFRADNPSTGTPADATEGFAMKIVSTVRKASDIETTNELEPMINKTWFVSEYLESPGAIRKGILIKRREIIEYFRNYAGGVRHNMLKVLQQSTQQRFELISELASHVRIDNIDGLHFELLSIGQAVARSKDIRKLAEMIRKDDQFTRNLQEVDNHNLRPLRSVEAIDTKQC